MSKMTMNESLFISFSIRYGIVKVHKACPEISLISYTFKPKLCCNRYLSKRFLRILKNMFLKKAPLLQRNFFWCYIFVAIIITFSRSSSTISTKASLLAT